MNGPGFGQAPIWTLAGLRGADPALGLALLMVVAVVVAEALHRLLRLPRACGYMLVGAGASPLLLRVLERSDIDPWKPMLDLAIAVLVFELGSRIRPRWLLDNPLLAVTCVLEAALSAACVWGALVWFGADPLSAAVAAAVAMSTSPVLTMVVLHETRARGQVTERLLIMSAVNSVLAMLALKFWGVAAGSTHDEWLNAGGHAVVVVSGSFLLGAGCAILLEGLSRLVRSERARPVLQIALVVGASMLAARWQLSPLLVLLIAGMIARHRMRHVLTVEPQLGSAGAVLAVLLLISLGVLFTLDELSKLWPSVAMLIGARLVGKGLAVALLARPSGLGWRQAAALTLALQPMSSLAVLLTASSFGWPAQLPGVELAVLQSLLAAITLMQVSGPLWSSIALRLVAREAGETTR